MERIANKVKHDPETNTTTVTVTRMDRTTYDVLIDTDHYWVIAEFPIHVIRTRWGRDDFYARVQIGGKPRLLHRVVGVRYLVEADGDRTEIDHRRPTETLDCRLSNLRAANRHEQMNNTRRSKQKLAA